MSYDSAQVRLESLPGRFDFSWADAAVPVGKWLASPSECAWWGQFTIPDVGWFFQAWWGHNADSCLRGDVPGWRMEIPL